MDSTSSKDTGAKLVIGPAHDTSAEREAAVEAILAACKATWGFTEWPPQVAPFNGLFFPQPDHPCNVPPTAPVQFDEI